MYYTYNVTCFSANPSLSSKPLRLCAVCITVGSSRKNDWEIVTRDAVEDGVGCRMPLTAEEGVLGFGVSAVGSRLSLLLYVGSGNEGQNVD